MADTKLSALTQITAATGADEFYINDSGTSKRITVADFLANLADPFVSTSTLTIGGDFAFTQADPEIQGGDTNGVLHITPSTTNVLGGGLKLYGDTHATKPDDIEFYGSDTLALAYDDSSTLWDFQANDVTTGGEFIVDVDGTAIASAGAVTMGAGADASVYWDGIDLQLDTATGGVKFSLAGVEQAHLDAGGLDLITGNEFLINAVSVLNATTLGTSVVTSSLTDVGALAVGSIASGFGNIDNGSSTFSTGVGTFTGLVHKTVTDTISAAGATQGAATALTAQINRVTTTVNTSADGVALPAAAAGLEIVVINDHATDSVEVWPATGDNIDGTGVDAADANLLTTGTSRRYVAVDGTNWYTA